MIKYWLPIFVFIGLSSCNNSDSGKIFDSFHRAEFDSIEIQNRLKRKAKELVDFASSNNIYNQDIAFMIDMKIPSSKKRFMVYNLKDKRIFERGLVAHGSGSETEGDTLKFSNIEHSNSTSLGMYKIGGSYKGQFGKAYKLHGLNKTNDQAYLRNVVLHSYDRVPDRETILPICNSRGCPMVSKNFFSILEHYIDQSKGKLILYIYY